MPYSSKTKLPPAVKKLGKHQQSIWMAAFNSAFKQYENEEKAFAVAWAAVRKRKDTAMRKDAFSWTETVALDRGNLRMTADGYMVAQARVARTGIQLYQGDEVGDARDIVRVYRPEKTVFDAKSMQTFAHKPVTLGHPPEMVNAHNWKDYAVGHVDGEIMRDGEMVRVPMMITDASAIEAVRTGASQLSVGYDARLEMIDGVTPIGEPYDAIQHDIRVNHIALTPSARGGPQLRLGDHASKEAQMAKDAFPEGDVCDPESDAYDEEACAAKKKGKKDSLPRQVMLRTLTFDGISVDMPETSAAIVNKVIDKLRTENQNLTGRVAALVQQVK
ncbi:MAG: ChaB family protein, partial [Tardiphaga sp.]